LTLSQSSTCAATLDDLVRRALRHVAAALGVQAVAEKDVVANRNGQRIGPLEDHSDLLAHLDQFDAGS
jgi:hypothetical protein